MDIENDLENFKNLGYKYIYNELTEMEEEIRIKKYFFKVVYLINELDNMIKNDIFKNAGIYSLTLKQNFMVEKGQAFYPLEILNVNNEIIEKYNDKGNYIAEYELITNLLDHYNFVLHDSLYNNDIVESSPPFRAMILASISTYLQYYCIVRIKHAFHKLLSVNQR